MKKGFTLIELLVVVLIIGILSAVALPQYTKAVNKARAAETWTLGKAFFDAQDIYLLETGKLTDQLEDLSIDIPNEIKNWTVTTGGGQGDVGSVWIGFNGKGSMSEIKMQYNVFFGPPPRKTVECLSEDCKQMMPCQNPDVGTGGNHYTCRDF
ncbi:MAG: type II secretion system protein [Elusimicrobiaceae bacterium]|nr:type II secretion system protein [Elusimicrobiaceae bacterium]